MTLNLKALGLGALPALALGLGLALATSDKAAARNEPSATLKPFSSDEAFRDFVRKVRKPAARRQMSEGMIPPPPPPPAPSPAATAAPAQDGAKSDAITNNQEAGVDEGGIVKNYGDYLVILRRGRLFTVSTADRTLTPIDAINAFPPGVTPSGDWYDEMLVAGDRVIVIGYSYARGGTEVNRFRISRDGRLTFEDAYHLKSNDYYSSRNYASRLIGTRLIVYSPLYLPYSIAENDAFGWLPGVRRWDGRNDRAAFKPMIDGRHIYRAPSTGEPGRDDIGALHTVMNCDLAAEEMECSAIGILGASSRTFYVSGNAVYVWVTAHGGSDDRAAGATVYRLPLDQSAPSAAGVRGAPIDQFSFREDWSEGRLNVLVRSEGGGDAMWRPEFSSGALALLQLPLSFFNDGTEDAPAEFYNDLPRTDGNAYSMQNRYVGNYLLYGAGNMNWGGPRNVPSRLFAVALRGGAVTDFALPHGVDRIEAMGDNAVVVGADQRNLNFQAIELTQGFRPELGDRYVLAGAAQGETRSHAFFFKGEPTWGDDSAGIVGLPIARAGRAGGRQLRENSAAILFLERANKRFAPMGELGAREDGVTDDACQASCADWYGNARPIFMKGRIFALMGYELVEGTRVRGAIRETNRVSFSPRMR